MSRILSKNVMRSTTEMSIDFMMYVWNGPNQFDSPIFSFNNKIEFENTQNLNWNW